MILYLQESANTLDIATCVVTTERRAFWALNWLNLTTVLRGTGLADFQQLLAFLLYFLKVDIFFFASFRMCPGASIRVVLHLHQNAELMHHDLNVVITPVFV